jgi:hypothetical protein
MRQKQVKPNICMCPIMEVGIDLWAWCYPMERDPEVKKKV